LPPELKCTKFDFGWDSAPDRAGELTLPNPLAVFKGPTSKDREERNHGREGRWRGRREDFGAFTQL